ncbi:MAG: MFS transporter [Calditrichaeota bacterium]|nr:MFS transporter [Calditrichota bacterium]
MAGNEKRKTIRIFALASFLNDFGSDMIYPVWPLFVTTVLHANMSVLGFIDGLGDAIVSVSQALSGYFSDRLRRRKIFIWVGYLFGSFSRIGYALSTTWQHLIPFRVLDRSGKIRSAPRDALVAEISTDADRGRNFGVLRTMDHLGAVMGILACILLIDHLGYQKLFLLAALPTLLGALLIFIFIAEPKSDRRRVFKGYDFRHLDNNLRLLFSLSAIFSLASFSYSFLLIFAKELGFRTAFVPVLYLIYTIFASATSLPFGKLADRVGRKNVLWLAYLLWIFVCVIFIAAKTKWIILAGFVLYGVHKGAFEPVSKTMIAELAPEKFKASVIGGYQMVTGLCALPASVIAGFLWDNFGKPVPFAASMAMTFVSIGLLFFVKEKKR